MRWLLFLALFGCAECPKAPQWAPLEEFQSGFTHATESLAFPVSERSQLGKNGEKRLRAIEREVNANPYNSTFHGYWMTEAEFLRYGGDCVSYATVDYIRFRRVGAADKDMDVAIVRLPGGMLHAILILRRKGREERFDSIAHPPRYEVLYLLSRAHNITPAR